MTKQLAKLGIAAALIAVAPLAFAQTSSTSADTSGSYTTTSTSGSTIGSTTPGTPNTGAGGDATTNAVVLTLSGLIALGGLAFLARTRKVA